jgi:hypothetical protein
MKEGTKTGDVVGRPSGQSSFLGDPGAIFFCGKLETVTKKEKRSKKERKRRPVETDAAVEIRKERGFPQRLGKHKTLSTVPTRPDGGSTDLIHQQGGAKSNDQKGPNQVGGSKREDRSAIDQNIGFGHGPQPT